MDKLFGLPAHPLLVHVPVVLVPLAGLAALAMLIRPRWLDRYGWWLLGLSGVGMIGAILAAGSGEELEGSVKRSSLLDKHAELGDTAQAVSIAFFVVVAVIVLGRYLLRRSDASLAQWLRTTTGAAVCALIVFLGGAAATFTVVRAGHQGAEVTWHDVNDQTNPPAGGDHD